MALDFLKRKTSPPAGLGRGVDGSSSLASKTRTVSVDGADLDGKRVVQRRHVEWLEHNIRWRWLMDSHEGGDRYRNAVYGPDRRGFPCRNLFRHKREYPDPQQFPNNLEGFVGGPSALVSGEASQMIGPLPGMLGADAAATAMDDDYELRRAQTPIPEFVGECVDIHLGKIYDGEVKRDGPDDLKAWWENVDGHGTRIDDYMRGTAAPFVAVIGNTDFCLDYPVVPAGQVVKTRHDEQRLGLDKVIVSHLLPMNVVWWRLDAAGRYSEALVREYVDPSDRMDYDSKGNAIDPDDPGGIGESWRKNYVRWRLWRSDESIVFNFDGSEVLERTPHNFGRVPITRCVAIEKLRTKHCGKSFYEAVAEYQREFYNRDSELILSDTLQAHPFLSGPEDYCKADNTLSVGPGYLLPKKKNPENGSYEGFEYVSPPKDPAESLRKNKSDLIDMKDRRACLAKPAGSDSPGTVGQSGFSKELDAHSGHKFLTQLAKALAKAEMQIAEYALLALRGGKVTPEDIASIKISYPMRFQLNDAQTLIDGFTKLQLTFAGLGKTPALELSLISAIVRQLLVGLDDEEYEEIDDEVELRIEAMSDLQTKRHEADVAGITNRIDALDGDGSTESDAGEDPTGESAGTMVSGVQPTAY